MVRKIYLLGIIVIGVVIGGGYLFFTLVKPKAFSDVIIQIQESTNQISHISWDQVTFGELRETLKEYQETGEFPNVSSDISPIDKYRFPNPFFLQNHNFGYIELFLVQVEAGVYQNTKVQPYQTVATYKTNINGEDYYLIIQRWINIDKSISFVPIITNNLLDYSALITNNAKFFPSPIVVIVDYDTCITLKGAGREYCSWYFNNIASYNEIRDSWLINSIIPQQITNFPILIIQASL